MKTNDLNLELGSSDNEKLAQIEGKIEITNGRIKSEKRESTAYAVLSTLCSLLIGFHYFELLVLPTYLIIIVWIVFVCFILALIGSEVTEARSELAAYKAIKQVMLKLPTLEDSKTHYFDSLVEINIENLSAYYTTVKVHTQQSFRVTITAGTVGFILIAVGILVDFQGNEYINFGYVSAGTGIIVEFISGVLFYLYNRTVRQLKEYHDSLINVQNILLSFKLIESTEDEKVKSEMVCKMIDYLVGKEQVTMREK